MSTRALYTIIDADTKAEPARLTRYGEAPAVKASKGQAWNVYIHGDGYPTGAARYVTNALEYAWELPRFEADEFAAALCAAAKEDIPGYRKKYPNGGTGGNARFMPQGKPLAVAAKHCCDIEYRYEIRANGVKAYSVDNTGKGTERCLFHCKIEEFAATAKAWEAERARAAA
jgi:hypothetical protein